MVSSLDSFDLVINTHLHWDHAGGNTVDEGGTVVPAFPNARYMTQRGELEHAREQHPRDAVSYRPVNYEPLLESGQHAPARWRQRECCRVFELQVTPGHNRDMMFVLLRSQGQTWCHLADLVQFAANVTPTWVSGFDLFRWKPSRTRPACWARPRPRTLVVQFRTRPGVRVCENRSAGGEMAKSRQSRR